jgi:hypothetical protein
MYFLVIHCHDTAKIMKLYRCGVQIEQNFRDEKSERFGFGLLATLSTVV